MAAIPPFETLGYEEHDGVAWVTLNRPDVYNAFSAAMQRELRWLWRTLRRHDDVRVIVLTGAGDTRRWSGACAEHGPLSGSWPVLASSDQEPTSALRSEGIECAGLPLAFHWS